MSNGSSYTAPTTYCHTAFILNSIMGIKNYCQLKLIVQSVLSLTHVDYLLHGHLLTNVPSLSVILKTVSLVFPELGGYEVTINTHSTKGFSDKTGKSSVRSV